MMDISSQKPIIIQTRERVRPKCPRCGSEMILIGTINDALGKPVSFAAMDRFGGSEALGCVKACYCNDCGEVTLTLE